jgi:galactose mutarotase-like enzyme
MIYQIQNDVLTVEIDSFGAQMKSLKNRETNREYLWSGNPEYWGKTSPVLFPFIGVIRNNTFLHEGKKYSMTRHGFARDMEFQLKEQGEDYIVFSLKDTEKTYEMYPFHFTFEIEHRLSGKQLTVLWRVINEGNTAMYFSVGGHPAFACPMGEQGKRTDCFLKFEDKDELIVSEIDLEKGLLSGEVHKISLDQGYLPITDGLFDLDALVPEKHQCHQVALCDEKKQPYIQVDFEAPLFGVWSVPDSKASYVCIEPWYGRCDRVDFDGELKDRDWTNSLEPGSTFEEQYTISVLK